MKTLQQNKSNFGGGGYGGGWDGVYDGGCDAADGGGGDANDGSGGVGRCI